MEWIEEFFINHWILVLIINILAFLFIVGFLIDILNSNKGKKNQKNKINDKIIFDQDIYTNDKYEQNSTKNDEVIINGVKDNNISNIIEDIRKNDQDIDDKNIIQDNDVFEEFDKVIPKRKIIDDDEKNELETFDDVEITTKKRKKNISIDIDIDLPNIDLPKDDEDIWS
ncbi:MAG: hypothetical protein IJR82_00770 [Bacilli bacterium]|nr:hypothetical protein [Bacilli bacterium]